MTENEIAEQEHDKVHQKGYELGVDETTIRIFLELQEKVRDLKCRCGEAPMCALCRRCLALAGRLS